MDGMMLRLADFACHGARRRFAGYDEALVGSVGGGQDGRADAVAASENGQIGLPDRCPKGAATGF